jgi:hypothetical protein
MDGAKRARSGKPRIRPSVDLHHPRLLPTRLHAARCSLGDGAPREHAAYRSGYLSHPRVICAICAGRYGASKRVIGRVMAARVRRTT